MLVYSIHIYLKILVLTTKQTKTFTSLNASNILKLVPEEEIYKYYLGYDFELNKCYTPILS